MMFYLPVVLAALLAVTALAGRSAAQADLYMLGTTIPRDADFWYQNHFQDSLRPSFEIEFAGVYENPSTDAGLRGRVWTIASWEPHLHMSWVYHPSGSHASIVWREDVGDWGYGINQFVVDTLAGWVQLPPGPYGDSGWARLVGYDEADGFTGSVSSISGQLILLDGVPAVRIGTTEEETVFATVLIESIDEGTVTFRPEIPSDMHCGEEVTPDPEVPRYAAPTGAFLTEVRQPRFRLAYPKGC